MLLTDRRATVRLHCELFNLFKTLSSHFSEFLSTYLYKCTLYGDNSLSVTVGTGRRQSLAPNLGKVCCQEKQVICEVEISTGKVDRG